ncbi:MAG TPA: efflux RND transporter periplasmic adaptor subunit [Gammaproteobacteria bacterium]|jgi:RND family efflux transporter MFP subunit|nr:efflux RND transporter periplasmic adaptor subunit [Gammaproteobacteria bacterium]
MPLDRDALDALRMDRGADDAALKRRSRPLLAGAALLLLAVSVLVAWLLFKPTYISVQTASARVVQDSPAAGAGARLLNASGYVVPRLQAVVSSKVTGKVSEVHVEEGMHVKAGQVLARLDDATARDQVNVAKSQFAAARALAVQTEVEHANAERDLARTRTLYARHLVSQADMDAATTREASLHASLESARQQASVAENSLALDQQFLDDTVIRAPFAGVVVSKDAQPGEMISPNSAGGGNTRTGIATVVDMSSLEIEVDVNEAYIGRVHGGQKVDAVLDAYPDWHIPSHVVSIIPTADRDKATVKVRVGFDQLDPRILPQMAIQVWFLGEGSGEASTPAARVQVPQTAVHRDGATPYVFIYADGRVERRAIKLGAVTGSDVEVLAGVAGDEKVITASEKPLADGMRVRENNNP